MPKFKLCDICEFITDGTHQTPKYCESGGYIFLSSKDVTSHRIDWANAKRIPGSLHEKLYSRLAPRKNDVLLAKNGTTGVAAIVDRDEIFDVYVSLAVLRPKAEIFPEYLLYAINSPICKRQFDAGLKGVGVPNLHLNVIRETEISVPSYSQQIEICKKLRMVLNIIEQRNNQLKKMEDLIKARFVEMFGDPEINLKGWKKEPLKDHATVFVGYPFPSEGYTSEGIDIVGGYNLMQGHILWDESKRWPDVAGYEQYLLRANDIVMAMDRPWVNGGFKIARIDASHLPALLIQRTACIRGKDLEQELLHSLLDTQRFAKHCNITGSLVPHISNKDINSYQVIVPPTEEQRRFTAFVTQVDKSKVVVQKSLDEMKLLFDSLMQEYFG